MVAHMKTTVEIADPLFLEAKEVASREGTTLRELIEAGLRKAIDERRGESGFRLGRVSFKGRGLQPHVREGDWEALREMAYEGRGG